MHVQETLMQQAGISINVAEDIVSPRIREVHNAIASGNHEQAWTRPGCWTCR